MTHKKITKKEAAKIAKKENLRWPFPEEWYEQLLSTGAKLCIENNITKTRQKFFVFGYASDGSDVQTILEKYL